TNVLVTLPTFHGVSRSTGPLAGSTVVVPAVASLIVPSLSSTAMRAPTKSPAAWWLARMLESSASYRPCTGGVVVGATELTGGRVSGGGGATVVGATLTLVVATLTLVGATVAVGV